MANTESLFVQSVSGLLLEGLQITNGCHFIIPSSDELQVTGRISHTISYGTAVEQCHEESFLIDSR